MAVPASLPKRLRPWFDHGLVAWSILFLSITVTLICWEVAREHVAKVSAEHFHYETDEATSLIQKRMLDYEQVLRAGVALFAASDKITREDWETFADQFDLNQAFPGIQGLGFAKYFRASELKGFEESVRAEGFPDFRVTPVYPRNEYTSILYLEPFDARNQRAFGFDMFSHPVRREAMERARDTGLPSMSGKVILLQETSTDIQPGMLTYLPVYKKGTAPQTVEERRSLLRGYVYAPFRIRNLMSGIFSHDRTAIHFRIYDGETVSPDTFLFDSSLDPNSGEYFRPQQNSPFKQVRVVEISGHKWTIEFDANERFENENASVVPGIVLASGLSIDFLFFGLVISIRSRQREEHIRAETATKKLREVSDLNEVILQNAGSAIVASDPYGNIILFNPAAEKMLGYSAAEMIHLLTPEVFHDRNEVAEEAVNLTRELGYPVPAGFEVFVAKARLNLPNAREWTFIHKDGHRFPVLLNVTAFRDEHQNIVGFLGVAQDISEHKRNARELAESLARVELFSKALDLHSSVVITDEQGRIEHVNDRFCDVCGFSREELIGQTPRILKSDTHDRSFFTDMWATIKQGEIWRGEICNRNKKGNLYWMDTTIIPILDHEGVPRRFIAVRTEITAQKRIVELLNETQRQASVGGWQYIVPTGELHWTDEVYRIHGLPIGTPITLDLSIAFYSAPDQITIRRAIEAALQKGVSWDLELRIVNSRRETVWVRTTGQVEFVGRKLYRIRGTFLDITQAKLSQLKLQASEERFRNLASVLPIGMFETDESGACSYINLRWNEITGMRWDNTHRHLWLEVVHPEDHDQVLANWNESTANQSDYNEEFRILRPDGQTRWIHAIASPLGKQSQAKGYVGTIEDITEYRDAVARIETSLGEKEVLLREVHHRVKNNLQLISSLLNLQAGHIKHPAMLAPFRESQGRIRSMALIHEMLYAHTSLAEIQADDYLQNLVGMVSRNHNQTLNPSTFDLSLEPIPLAPDKAIPLGLIVNELLTNAFKYGLRGTPEDRITLHCKLVTSDLIQLDFSDNGPGMPPDFDPQTNRSLGFRLISMLSKQIHAEVLLPASGQSAHYRFTFRIANTAQKS